MSQHGAVVWSCVAVTPPAPGAKVQSSNPAVLLPARGPCQCVSEGLGVHTRQCTFSVRLQGCTYLMYMFSIWPTA